MIPILETWTQGQSPLQRSTLDTLICQPWSPPMQTENNKLNDSFEYEDDSPELLSIEYTSQVSS